MVANNTLLGKISTLRYYSLQHPPHLLPRNGWFFMRETKMITAAEIAQKLQTYKTEMGLRLRTDRQLNELTIEQLATLTGVDIQTITDLEDGLYTNSIEPFFKISLANELLFQELNQETQKLLDLLQEKSSLAVVEYTNPFKKP